MENRSEILSMREKAQWPEITLVAMEVNLTGIFREKKTK